MKCPICNLDLNPLDLVSRTEHVDLCIEHGPAIVEIDNNGQAVIKKSIPIAKLRKICPICDKTFQNIHQHFKTCSLKHDLSPSHMLDYWDRINKESKNPKKFPRDLLESFVRKCLKDGRIGDELDFAKALWASLAEEGELLNEDSLTSSILQSTPNETSTSEAKAQQQPSSSASQPPARNVDQVLMQTKPVASSSKNSSNKKYRLELASDSIKESNIVLRIDREVAATRSRRYEEALKFQQQEDCIVIDQDIAVNEVGERDERNKLFFRARLKDCDGSESCLKANCDNHELLLLMEDFVAYSGPPMDSKVQPAES